MTRNGDAEITVLNNDGCPDLPLQASEPGVEHAFARKHAP